MRNQSGEVIYVGKSRALKNRVSQYFSGGAKNAKTERMVSGVYDFDYILCDTELESLALENSKIKQYSPRYNIKLKDDKSYPYIKVTTGEYPRVIMTRKRVSDGGSYYGPYSNSDTARTVIRTVSAAVGTAACGKIFPRDIGKSRPCLYSQIGRCCAPCTGKVSPEEYAQLIREVKTVLSGSVNQEVKELTEKMNAASEELNFELAAKYRDRIKALSSLHEKQKVVADPEDDIDAVGLYTDDAVSVITFFYIRGGAITDTETYDFTSGAFAEAENLSSFLASVYEKRQPAPIVLLSAQLEEAECAALSQYLTEKSPRKISVRSPQRGKYRALCEMVAENSAHRAEKLKEVDTKETATLARLASLLQLEVVPERIEAFDISNYGDENITAGMITLDGMRFSKADYRVFKIKTVSGEDDYASMREAVERRIRNTIEKHSTAYPKLPDLLLIDGGKTHVAAVKEVLGSLGVSIPTFGMVKDDFHKTRALCDEEREVSIANDKAIYTFIYRIQEEVHRFAISKMSGAKRKTLKTSSLEKINGIGPAKAKALLSHFGTFKALSEAGEDELTGVKGITPELAKAVREYFE